MAPTVNRESLKEIVFEIEMNILLVYNISTILYRITSFNSFAKIFRIDKKAQIRKGKKLAENFRAKINKGTTAHMVIGLTFNFDQNLNLLFQKQ